MLCNSNKKLFVGIFACFSIFVSALFFNTSSAHAVTLSKYGSVICFGNNYRNPLRAWRYQRSGSWAYCATPSESSFDGSSASCSSTEWNNDSAKLVMAVGPGGPYERFSFDWDEFRDVVGKINDNSRNLNGCHNDDWTYGIIMDTGLVGDNTTLRYMGVHLALGVVTGYMPNSLNTATNYYGQRKKVNELYNAIISWFNGEPEKKNDVLTNYKAYRTTGCSPSASQFYSWLEYDPPAPKEGTCAKRYRLENADGTWGGWTNETSTSVTIGGTCSYSKTVTNYRGGSANGSAGSASCTVSSESGCTASVSLYRNTFALTVNKNDTHIASVSGAGTYRWGQSVSIGATAKSGHGFSSWSKTSGSGTIASTTSASTTFTMDKSAATVYADGYGYSHTLKYDGNGCSTNVPSTQSVTNTNKNHTFTISSTQPTASSGYSFLGWATSSTATSVGYSPGGTISVGQDATVTLYAVCQSEATFTASVGTPVSNSDTNIKSQSGRDILGDGSTTSYKLKTTTTLKRTNSIPNKAVSKYSISSASQPTTAGTNSNSLGNNETQSIADSATFTQAVGTSGNHYFYFTYEDKIKYVQSTKGTATLDKKNNYVTIYNPQYATFTCSVDASSTNMTGSASTMFRGTGYDDMDYNITATFNIKRTNSSPTSAVSRYEYSTSNQYPTAPSRETAELSNNSVTTIPVKIEFKLQQGAAAVEKCFSLKFDNRVGYIGTNRLTTPFDTREFNGTCQICPKVYNPVRRVAVFSGSISAANSTGLSGTTGSRVGNGLHSRYILTPTYTIKRTNNSPTWGVTSRYAYVDSGSSYPSSPTDTTKALTNNQTDTKTPSGKTVNVDIDGTATQCFYLSYDDQVEYLDSDINSRQFGGKKSECYTFTNPHQEYLAHYSATTDGVVDAHDRLNRSNSNRTGILDNQSRITGTSTDTDGSFQDNFPADDKYTATFTHVIKRTDANASSTAGTVYYVASANTKWTVQYCEDAACDADTYSDYKATQDRNSSTVKVSGQSNLEAGATDTITTKPVWTLNASNKGKYIYTCQRIKFNTITKYNTATNTSDRDSYVDNIVERTNAYSTPICVTIKNPLWYNNIVKSYENHFIDVDGQTGSVVVTGARSTGGVTYETTELDADFLFNHSLARHDNYNVSGRNTSNFDETDSWVHFYQPSIYNNNNYSVSTKMWGNERLPGTRNSATLINPIKNTTSTVNGYEVSLNARSKSDGNTWDSNSANGRTKTTFTNSPTGDYSLLAGQTKNFSHSTYNTRAAWRVQYKNVYRQETYTGWAANKSQTEFYDRTEKVSKKARYCILDNGTDRDCTLNDAAVTPTTRDSADPTVYSVTRPYHYIITDVKPSSKPSTTTYYGQEFSKTFNIDVARPTSTYNYITDMRDHRAFIIEYKIPAGADINSINNAILGGTTGYSGNVSNDICSGFYTSKLSSIYGCSVLEDGGTKITPKTNNPNNNYVYGAESYRLSYTTGSIKVPKLNLGDKYCVALAIAKYSSSSNDWYISKSACSNVSKRPMVHVLGGDVRGSGTVSGSITEYDGKKYGSWSDFIVSSSKETTGFGSSASLASGVTSSDSSLMCKISKLTIANEQCLDNPLSTELGSVNIPITETTETMLKKMQDYYIVAGDDRDENGCDSVSCLIETNNVTASTFTNRGLRAPDNFISSKPIILYSSGSIDINTNIMIEPGHVYNDGITPQIIIIAENNIRVGENVTRIDAWIVAGGRFISCIEGGNDRETLSADNCDKQLVVKGAITAESIEMNRTYGGDPNAASTVLLPAEKIYYSPMTLIYAAREATRNAEPQTTYLNEISPRY